MSICLKVNKDSWTACQLGSGPLRSQDDKMENVRSLYKHHRKQAVFWVGPLVAHLTEDNSRISFPYVSWVDLKTCKVQSWRLHRSRYFFVRPIAGPHPASLWAQLNPDGVLWHPDAKSPGVTYFNSSYIQYEAQPSPVNSLDSGHFQSSHYCNTSSTLPLI